MFGLLVLYGIGHIVSVLINVINKLITIGFVSSSSVKISSEVPKQDDWKKYCWTIESLED
jgi:hypothetical protein